jgi:hypothetical protein
MKNAEATTIYREFLWPSVNSFIAIAIVWPTIWLTVYPWDHNLGSWIGLGAVVFFGGLAILRSKTIEVTTDELVIGNVRIPRSELGKAVALSGEDARLERGPKLNPAAYVVFRGTTQKLVKVTVSSRTDPTPYWLFSTRKPDALAEVLNSAA